MKMLRGRVLKRIKEAVGIMVKIDSEVIRTMYCEDRGETGFPPSRCLGTLITGVVARPTVVAKSMMCARFDFSRTQFRLYRPYPRYSTIRSVPSLQPTFQANTIYLRIFLFSVARSLYSSALYSILLYFFYCCSLDLRLMYDLLPIRLSHSNEIHYRMKWRLTLFAIILVHHH